MAGAITPIVMPKWGLEMREGTIAAWLVEEGTRIAVGTPIVDVETDKISNAVEAPDPGLLRRRVAQAGETLPVKALLGVLAEPDVSDADIDAYIAGYVVPAAERRRRGGRGLRDLPRLTACACATRAAGEGRRAGALHPRLRRRPRQLAVQPGRAGRGARR
jgi:pyruvate/2-oxoglutarate dehydrogenase complex dihydrolipoamide acyltransferase (E2) component